VLGTVAANRLPGDPVWLVLVGPPSGGKSELIQAVGELPEVHSVATLTEAGLLSGTPRRERDASASGGLLREIGAEGLILCKDFTSVLAMHRDTRAALLAAMREIYDGAWTRHVGVDGGRKLHWSGRVGLIAGSTPTIDRHHGVMSTMGERFVLFRLPKLSDQEQARRALAQAGHEAEMRAELAGAVSALLEAGVFPPRELAPAEIDVLVAISTFVVRARSAVERDGYSREIELVPGSESPARLVKVLSRLLAGLDAIGVERPQAWRVVAKAALDSIPALRLAALDALYQAGGKVSTTSVAERIRYPTSTTRRALEELEAHDMIDRTSRGSGRNADTWELRDQERVHYELCVPEMSEPLLRVCKHTNDKSGTQTATGDVSGTRTASLPGCRACDSLRARGALHGCHQHRPTPNEAAFLATVQALVDAGEATWEP
jgi:hypothetical protein